RDWVVPGVFGAPCHCSRDGVCIDAAKQPGCARVVERGGGNYRTAAGTATRGKSTVKTHPVRARLRAEMRPLLASTPQRLNAKPKPMPVRSALRCANGRNSSS